MTGQQEVPSPFDPRECQILEQALSLLESQRSSETDMNAVSNLRNKIRQIHSTEQSRSNAAGAGRGLS